jgi:hypothetical protein
VPNFTDFLFAPWKVIGALLNGMNPPKVVGGVVQQSSLCSVQDVGGQALNVCTFAGYEMPAFVFVGSCLIFLLFFVSSVWMIFASLKLTATLSSLQSQIIKNISAKTGKFTTAELEKLRAIMQKEGTLSNLWDDFESCLIPVGGSEIYRTRTVESTFTPEAVITPFLGTGFFNAIPGILTGLGLLMTFVAILEGLSHVSVSANMDVKGIGGLINGLSGKFFSSIVALTCAVLFVFVERIAFSRPTQQHRKLVNLISSRIKNKSIESLLNQICNQLSKST